MLKIGTFKTPHSLHFQNAVHSSLYTNDSNQVF